MIKINGRRRVFALSAAALAAVFSLACMLTFSGGEAAYANSAPMYYYGSEIAGLQPPEDCPLEVLNENLVLDISGLPDLSDMSKYSSTVTAEYTFYNPSEEELTVGLLFPLGTMPEYVLNEYNDLSLFCVTVEGEEADYCLRSSYNGGYSYFDFERASAYLSDSPRANPVLSPYAQTTLYEITPQAGQTITAQYTAEADFVAFLKDVWNYNLYGRRVTVTFSDEGMICFAGKVPDDLQFTLCSDSAEESYAPSSEVLNFSEIISGYMPSYLSHEDKGETDWFNYIADYVFALNNSGEPLNLDYILWSGNLIMRWVEYEFTIPAGGTLENAVTVPVYPEIYSNEYIYNYLLSPAEGWADFGTLNIKVNTPYNIAYSSPGTFEKSEGSYTASFIGLPEGELVVVLGDSQKGIIVGGISLSNFIAALILIPIILAFCFILSGLIVVIVLLCKKR